MSEMLTAAIAYAARGWHVFPLHTMIGNQCSCGATDCPDAGKHPRVRRGLKEATTDPAKINEWFGPGAPPANIGIATGEMSGVTVLDIDIGEGKQGAETWAALIAEKGEPQTLMARTGSGGTHVFFRYNSALKTAANVLGPGVDVRNDGGYVVAPPGRHRSGNAYAWLADADALLADLPAHLAQRKETRGRPKAQHAPDFTLSQVREMLDVIPADDRDRWRSVGIILGRAFRCSPDAWQVYVEWSAKWGGKEGRNHTEIMHEAFHDLSQQTSDRELSIGTIVKLAQEHGWEPKPAKELENFWTIHPANRVLYVPTGALWQKEAVNAALPKVIVGHGDNGKPIYAEPALWLARNRGIEAMLFDPALPQIVEGQVARQQGIVPQPGARSFNTYQPPLLPLGDAKAAAPFVEHVHALLPNEDEARHLLDYLAHLVQHPGIKIRHAILIGGPQGIGKDTIIDFIVPAIGEWNHKAIDPAQMFSAFNEFRRAVLVRINEIANLNEAKDRYTFYELTKNLIAGSPDWVEVNEKYGVKSWVRNVGGVVLTTNHLDTGIYLPAEDRRHFVIKTIEANALRPTLDERKAYFKELWAWFHAGGAAHVAAFLRARDLRNFDPNAEPPKTDAFRRLVATGAHGDVWLLDALARMGEPEMFRMDQLRVHVDDEVISPEKVSRMAPHVLSRLGYEMHMNPDNKAGRWSFYKDGKQRETAVYVKREKVPQERARLMDELREAPTMERPF